MDEDTQRQIELEVRKRLDAERDRLAEEMKTHRTLYQSQWRLVTLGIS